MSTWNEICLFTDYPIYPDDSVGLVVLNSRGQHIEQEDDLHGEWTPDGPIFSGYYDGYGGLYSMNQSEIHRLYAADLKRRSAEGILQFADTTNEEFQTLTIEQILHLLSGHDYAYIPVGGVEKIHCPRVKVAFFYRGCWIDLKMRYGSFDEYWKLTDAEKIPGMLKHYMIQEVEGETYVYDEFNELLTLIGVMRELDKPLVPSRIRPKERTDMELNRILRVWRNERYASLRDHRERRDRPPIFHRSGSMREVVDALRGATEDLRANIGTPGARAATTNQDRVGPIEVFPAARPAARDPDFREEDEDGGDRATDGGEPVNILGHFDAQGNLIGPGQEQAIPIPVLPPEPAQPQRVDMPPATEVPAQVGGDAAPEARRRFAEDIVAAGFVTRREEAAPNHRVIERLHRAFRIDPTTIEAAGTWAGITPDETEAEPGAAEPRRDRDEGVILGATQAAQPVPGEARAERATTGTLLTWHDIAHEVERRREERAFIQNVMADPFRDEPRRTGRQVGGRAIDPAVFFDRHVAPAEWVEVTLTAEETRAIGAAEAPAPTNELPEPPQAATVETLAEAPAPAQVVEGETVNQ